MQIPKVYGGAEGNALYVDTHGDFSADRLTEMAKSQTGRLLSTALGEFLGIAITSIENNNTPASPVPSSPATTILEYRPGEL